MRKLNLISGVLGLAALGLTACSNETPVNNDGNGVAEKDEVRYMRVSIANPTSTRADDDESIFQDASTAENKVGSLYFLFYDSNGNPINAETLEMDDLTDVSVADEDGNIGAVKQLVVSIAINRGESYPAYVMCFINPVSWNKGDLVSTDEDGNSTIVNMEGLRDVIRENYIDGAGNYAMTNSVYFGTDKISGATNVKMSGAPILASQLYTTKKAAEDSTTPVDIYVERYAAKINFQLGADAVKAYDLADSGYHLTFSPEFWSINAAAPTMYAVKRYSDDDSSTNTIPTIGSVQDMLGNWTDWNAPTLFRSYWACSPGFYATQFPQVSDNLIDNATSNNGAGVQVGNYALRYYSYNQIAGNNSYNGFGKGVTVTPGTLSTKYSLENTMGSAAFASLNPKAAAPSVVLVGHYNVTKGDVEIAVPTEGFCIYDGSLYYQGNTVPATDNGGQTILNRLLDENQILYTGNTDEDGNTVYERITSENCPDAVRTLFTVDHPVKAVRGTQAVPHRYVTLQLKEGTETFPGLYYMPDGSSTFVPVEVNAGQTAAQVRNSVNLLLWQQIGNASAYTQSKCYFSIPIQHLGITENVRTGDEAPIDNNGKIVWNNVKVGDFGLVRNHVYTIIVDEIAGRADGIQGLSNPLVPSMETNDYWVKYRINILNWRIVPTQNVKL